MTRVRLLIPDQRAGRAVRRVLGRARRSWRAVVRRSRRTSGGADGRVVRARQAWASGRRAVALDELRRALLVDATRPELWLLYAQWSVGMQRSDLALEAVKSALDLRPWYLDALELLVELVRVKDRGPAVLVEALDELARTLPAHPQMHRDALAFAVPERHEACLRVLAISRDPVPRASVAIVRGQRAPEDAAGLNPGDTRLAQLLAALALGRIAAAATLLSGLPDDALPSASVRRAIRRLVGRNLWAEAATLAEQYLRARPGDVWARRVCRDAARPQIVPHGSVADYRLITTGFPFAAPVARPAWEPDPAAVLYLLHNSLPYASAGYATRSHGLLRALNDGPWHVRGVTRLGFPFDTPGHGDLDEASARDRIDGVDYLRLTTHPGTWRKNPIVDYVGDYSAALENLAVQYRPWLLHAASNHWNGLTAVQTARRLGLRSVYEVRGLWELVRGSRDPEWWGSGGFQLISRLEADAASAADRVITITAGLRDELVERGVDADKIVVVPNGVDTARFVPVPPDRKLRAELGLVDKTVIGYVGSVLDYEGLDLLVRAAAVLGAERADMHVLVVGDGAERERIEALAASLGLLGRVVTFTGAVPHEQVERYYSLVDIAPFPRLPLPVTELVSPLKPFEAMAMGKAVVASDVGALAEIVRDGDTGLLHRKGDLDDLVRQLRTVLDDPDLRVRLGRQARQWVERERDWRRLAGLVADVYQDLGVPAECLV